MNKSLLDQFTSWFKNYAQNFYTEDNNYNYPLKLKEKHTGCVCHEIRMISGSLDLPGNDLLLAETIALFHDLGRFRQYARFGTFRDSISVNHAKQGIMDLSKHSVLSPCSKEERRIITRAIAYHNAFQIPPNQDGKSLLFMKLIRDADKLDIWRVFIEYFDIKDRPENSAVVLDAVARPDISPRILEALSEGKMALIKDVKTQNDYKLIQVSWVYDLNFTASFRAVKERRIIERLASFLPLSDEKVREAIAKVAAFVESKAG